MNMVSNVDSMKVKLLSPVLIRGNFHKAGTVVTVSKFDARGLISRERAVPHVEEPAPVPAPVDPEPAPAPVESKKSKKSQATAE